MIVLDTNVLSELIRPEPNSFVFAWAQAYPLTELFTTVITESEILYGVELLPVGKRRHGLMLAVERLFNEALNNRVLPFDRAAAQVYPEIVVNRRRSGHLIHMADAQIAAISVARGAQLLATRNVADFEDCGIAVVNPWIPQDPR